MTPVEESTVQPVVPGFATAYEIDPVPLVVASDVGVDGDSVIDSVDVGDHVTVCVCSPIDLMGRTYIALT